MKILNREQIQEADRQTITQEPIPSIDLMERAAWEFAQKFKETFIASKPIYIFCGQGNNGGDGLAIGRLLAQNGYAVHIVVVGSSSKPSEDFNQNWNQLSLQVIASIEQLASADDLPPISSDAVIIDAMLGSGLDRPLKGLIADIVEALNNYPAPIVAVDIPTGIYCDTLNTDSIKIAASYTFTFELYKLSFMLPEVQPYIGEVKILPIGLLPDHLQKVNTPYHLLDTQEISGKIEARKPYQHKGHFGHALLMVGAYGTIGAAQLAANASLRSGLGLLTLAAPYCGYIPLQTAVPEGMLKPDPEEKYLTTLPDLKAYDAIGIGPGIGQEGATEQLFEDLLRHCDQPLVLDADALNLLSKQAELWSAIPHYSIITPHPGEFQRLTSSGNSLEQLQEAQNLASEYNIYIVLKGNHTAIIQPDGHVYFNSTGNPGMATGGSGDTLTGLITGLLAQGYQPAEAAKIGVFVHGLAGDLASQTQGQVSLIARDLVNHLPKAFQQIAQS
jgi:hydroxyethylthiazole kinase-like uncharacterized protein yjeF